MTSTDLLRHRCGNQQLTAGRFTDPTALVAWFGAMQAQEYAMVKWALALRLPAGTTDAILDEAFNAGQFLRTHVLRPTWHLVAPADIRWLLALTAPRVHAACAFGRRQFGLTPDLLRRSDKIITKALASSQHLTRDEIEPALRRAKLPTAGIPLAHLFIHAELGGLICSGPRRGKQFTYALLDSRVPATAPLCRDEALAKLSRRYFASRGPATAQDFAWWSGLTLTDAKRGVATLDRDFLRESFAEKTYILPAPPSAISAATGSGRLASSSPRRTTRALSQSLALPTFLMPDYDEYGIAYEDRTVLFAESGFEGKYRDARLAYNRMLVIDGRIVGSWKRTDSGKTVDLEVVPLAPLSKTARQEIGQAVQRYSAFLGKPVTPRFT